MRVRLLSIFAASMLTACGGGSSSGDSNTDTTAGNTTTGDTTGGDMGGSTGGGTGGGTGDSVTLLGFVDVDQFFDGASLISGELTAGFLRSTTPINLTALTNELRPTSDVCEVEENVGFFDDLEDDITGIDFTEFVTISAGETITFTSPAGTYTTLNRESAFGFSGYALELDANNPVPANLTVDIPGDEFPAFSNVAVPAAAPLTGLNISTGNQVNAGSTITWDAGSNPGSTMSISLSSAFDINNTTMTHVDCFVVDDGSFTFPAATQSQMGGLLFDHTITRDNFTIIQNGNTVLVVSAHSG